MPRGNKSVERRTCPFTTSMVIIILLNIFYLNHLCFDVYSQYAMRRKGKIFKRRHAFFTQTFSSYLAA